MRRMSKVWWALVVGVSLGVTLVGVSPVKAAPLTNTQISWAQFLNFADITTPLVDAPPFIDYFDFTPENPPGDGEIFSAVYPGKGPAAGKYVYVYQVYHYSESSAVNFTGFAFPAFTTLGPVPIDFNGDSVPDTSFYIVPAAGDPANPPIGTTANSWGTKKPTSFGYSPNPPNSDITISYVSIPELGIDDVILRGQVGYIFGFVHSLPPTVAKANTKDSGTDALEPLVYTPSPEPTSFVLLSAGLLGLVAIRRRRS